MINQAVKPWYVIDPRKSKWMPMWDGVSFVAMLFTALVTPFEVAFLEPPDSWATAGRDPLFALNRVVDSVFMLDLMLQFVIMFKREE